MDLPLHMICDDFLEDKMEDCHHSVLVCALQLCIVINTLKYAVLISELGPVS